MSLFSSLQASARLVRMMCAGVLFTVSTVVSVQAAEDTPFYTGVWELKTQNGLQPLVMSDWLIFEGKTPGIWMYLRPGFVSGQRYQFVARRISVNGVSAAIVDVAKVDDTHMSYRLSANGNVIEQGEATRLSVPNAHKSCLAVDTDMKDLLGKWKLTQNSKKSLVLKENELELDGKKQTITMQQLRKGQLALMVNGVPFAMFTDAGGDYGVLQILPAGTKAFTGGPIGQHVVFDQEIVVRRPGGRCDAAIAGRLKLLGKKR
ncbi:hypothetical protein [uncultured Cohaesibacter sp.]|uniref:hypothetical protein n=1 Tax=uncultured Cohaesibacter sp. TaxID=1002546 RepID=UPI0029C70B3F|nr:hypothetical protein [uncultured Cohaesibacter sp.]